MPETPDRDTDVVDLETRPAKTAEEELGETPTIVRNDAANTDIGIQPKKTAEEAEGDTTDYEVKPEEVITIEGETAKVRKALTGATLAAIRRNPKDAHAKLADAHEGMSKLRQMDPKHRELREFDATIRDIQKVVGPIVIAVTAAAETKPQ